MCKQLAQGCYPVEQWRDPGFEPRSPGSHSKCANHYTTERDKMFTIIITRLSAAYRDIYYSDVSTETVNEMAAVRNVKYRTCFSLLCFTVCETIGIREGGDWVNANLRLARGVYVSTLP